MPNLVPDLIAPGTLSGVPQPVLTAGPGLLLRPWTAADAPMIVDAFRDPATRHWHCRSVESVAEAEELIDGFTRGWRTETSATWAVVTAGGEVLGRVALRAIGTAKGEAEVAYWMRAAARGRGAAPAGVGAMSAWAFGVGLHRLILNHSTRNEASCRVAQKTGFELEGVRRSAELHVDGWHDVHLHALIGPSDQREDDPLGPYRAAG
ncbi:Protein N-acetyltransferase, RimJ/RimL family [Nonomuraea solani]|uniref:Protein N-acetyltransferase, RimJ/RimL family n=1 Tax=Nonomuraea solani TaxID=1144553 RepID=A0A1H6EWF0_9ACTN|nr:GNAT family N-acetyltransferase [Nonomuraea solani]SEH01245.1 Protein N-acetyltransferase, RimJ/RimL family [Nonomuraea solani]